MNYSDKLKDPRWQKKRLEILSRDNFTCKFCGDTKTTLHVHHLKYSGDPWESCNFDLITLCEKCHKKESIERSENENNLLECLRLLGVSSDLIEMLYRSIYESEVDFTDPNSMNLLCGFISNRLNNEIIEDEKSTVEYLNKRKVNNG